MSERLATAGIILAIFAVGIAASYGLAQAGEPQSAWLWSHFR